MTTLTRVELRRLLARKILHVTLLAIVVTIGASLWGLSSNLRTPVQIEQQARADLEMALQDWEMYAQDQDSADVQQCLEDERRERNAQGDQTIDFGCVWEEPVLEDFLEGYRPPSLADSYEQLLVGTGMLVFFAALLGGSTFTAAEHSHRTLGTWLTFEPRRDRVFGSKILAAGLAALPVAVIAGALILLGTAALYKFKGVDDAVTPSEWADLGWMGARIVLLAVVLGMVGAAAGLLLRNTGAVLGIVVGYLLVVENLVNGLVPSLSRYLISNNLLAWVNDGHTLFEWRCGPTGECREVLTPISLEHGALVIGIVALAVILASWLVFRRRDVD